MSLTAAAVSAIVLCNEQTQERRARPADHSPAAPGRESPHRNCGKEGCRCTQGEPHGPYVYLQVAGRLMYVPAVLADAVRAHLQTSQRLRRALEDISAINLELLARRELD